MEMIGVASLLRMMPMGYEEACYSTKAIVRNRGIKDPNDLMMLALFHLLTGCSWLNGKLMVALLVESVIGSADFFPCKYDDEEYLEGDENDKPVIINQPV